MPWNNQGGGGPWGGGGNKGGGQNPWGQRPSGGGGGGNTPPDFDEMIRKGQERLKRLFPGGGGYKGFVLIGIAVIGLWLLTGFYRVQPGEQGVTLLFGKWVGTTGPGLNYFLPAPIGEVIKPNVERTNQIEVGYRGAGTVTSNGSRDVPEESLMLTGDQNIIDIDYVVQWRISDAGSYLFNVRDPENTIKLASESAIREVIGKTDLEEALTVGRVRVEEQTRTLLQEIMDGYESGIFIAEVKMQKVDRRATLSMPLTMCSVPVRTVTVPRTKHLPIVTTSSRVQRVKQNVRSCRPAHTRIVSPRKQRVKQNALTPSTIPS